MLEKTGAEIGITLYLMYIFVLTAAVFVSVILNTVPGKCEDLPNSKPPHGDKTASDFLVVKGFFVKGFELYDQALPFVTNSAVKTSDIGKSEEKNFAQAVNNNSARVLVSVREMVKNKTSLNDSQRDFLMEAVVELGKGLAEWEKRNLAKSLSAGVKISESVNKINESVNNGRKDNLNSLAPEFFSMGLAVNDILSFRGALMKLFSETKKLGSLK